MQDAENARLVHVARMALRIGTRCLSDYSCAKSRHDYKQAQLMTCLVLKMVTRNDYRGVCELLTLAPALREAIGLAKVPHYTTLQKFMARPQMPAIVDGMIGEVLRETGVAGEAPDVAVDSTGLHHSNASIHYHTRRGTSGRARKTVKLSVAVVCGALLPAALVVDLGSSPDMRQMPALMDQIEARLTPNRLFADAGYDAEWVHEVCRERWGTESLIPPVIRTADGSVKTKWRALMAELPAIYGRRWHVESFFSGLKRTTMSSLSGRSAPTLLAEAATKVLAYAIRR